MFYVKGPLFSNYINIQKQGRVSGNLGVFQKISDMIIQLVTTVEEQN